MPRPYALQEESFMARCLGGGAWLAAVLVWVLTASGVAGEDWPTRQPIKVIAPASAGSTSDIMARIVFEQVGRQLGQTVVVENRGGAGTTTGWMEGRFKTAPCTRHLAEDDMRGLR